MKNFGKLLKDSRTQKGLKLSQVSVQLGIDQAILSKLERGLRRASRKQVTQFVQYYGLEEQIAFTAWLSDKILAELQDEYYATDALIVAEKEIQYLRKNQTLSDIPFSDTMEMLVKQVDQLQGRWANKKPLDKTQLNKLREYFMVNYTFESNRIEGNTLSLQETHLVVNEGLTIAGKTMQEHLEAVNHYEAIDYIEEIVQNKVPISERVVKQIHYLVLKGIDRANAGVYRSVPVIISGSMHTPPQPFLLARMMEELFEFYDRKKNILHPVILAAAMHEKLVTIHPFIDGNGRTSRLLMNLILLKHGYTIANLKGSPEAKLTYYQALESARTESGLVEFYQLILQSCIESLTSHLELAGDAG